MLFGEGTQDLKSTGGNKGRISTVKPVYDVHSREPENIAFMSSCPLNTS